MFEKHIAGLLERYIGRYVKKFALEQASIRDTTLNNLELREDAFKGLDIAVRVKSGTIGSIRLKVPALLFTSSSPIIIEISDIYAVLEPCREKYDAKEETCRQRRLKLKRLKKWAEKRLEEKSPSGGWSWSLKKTILAYVLPRLKVTIRRVHVRLEDGSLLRGKPFALGIYCGCIRTVPLPTKAKENEKQQGTVLSYSELKATNVAVYLLAGWSKASSPTRAGWSLEHSVDCSSAKALQKSMGRVFDEKVPTSSECAGRYMMEPIPALTMTLKMTDPASLDSEGQKYVPDVLANLICDPVKLKLSKPQLRAVLGFIDAVSNFKIYAKNRLYRYISPPPLPLPFILFCFGLCVCVLTYIFLSCCVTLLGMHWIIEGDH